MKHYPLLLFLVLLFSPLLAEAQSLPENYVSSTDGHVISRLQQGTDAGFYGEDSVKTIALTFADTSWWSQIDDSVGYAQLRYGDLILDSVAVRIKGSSSDFANNTLKKSFDLEFDAIVEDQHIEGYDQTNLHCGIFDPSNVRENVFNWIGGHYLPIAKSNFIHLTINGQNWGAYTNTQQLDKAFLREWFVDPSGPRWRGESPYGRIGPDTTCVNPEQSEGRQATPSALHYLGQDSAAYWPYYIPKGAHGAGDWGKLTNFIDKLNNIPEHQLVDSLDQYLNVDGALWFLAHEILLGDEDSYVFKTQSDYYLYHEDVTGRMIPLEYDGNSCMEGRSKEWSPLHRASDPCLPLLHRLLEVPEWRQRYLAHCRTIVEEYMHPDIVLPKIAYFAELIDPFEMDDPIGDSLYTYQEFQSGINSLNSYVVDRYDFLHNHPLLNQPACSISIDELQLSGGRAFEPSSRDSVFASVQVGGYAVDSAYVYYAAGVGQSFRKSLMYDDGLHGDGFANDGRFGGVIPPFPAQTSVVYYFEVKMASVEQTASYYPDGAEHEVFSYQVEIDRTPSHPLKINEVMASNATIAVDEEGKFEDWVELYNSSFNAIDLEGYAFSDKEEHLQKWIVDTSLVIPSKGYLILWCDDDEEDGPNHTNFKLSKSGEHLFLSNPRGAVIDDVRMGQQTTDISFAREVDGSGGFVQQVATFNASNRLLASPPSSIGGVTDSVVVLEPAVTSSLSESSVWDDVVLYPNPVGIGVTEVHFAGLTGQKVDVEIVGVLGNILQSKSIWLSPNGTGSMVIDRLASGVYTVMFRGANRGEQTARRLTVHF